MKDYGRRAAEDRWGQMFLPFFDEVLPLPPEGAGGDNNVGVQLRIPFEGVGEPQRIPFKGV